MCKRKEKVRREESAEKGRTKEEKSVVSYSNKIHCTFTSQHFHSPQNGMRPNNHADRAIHGRLRSYDQHSKNPWQAGV